MAKKLIGKGGVTIVDLSDAQALQSYMTMSQGTAQIYDKDKKVYVPDYSVAPHQVVTINCYLTGSNEDLGTKLQAQTWKINGAAISGANYVSAPGSLTIKANMTAAVNRIEFAAEYYDQETGLATPVKISGTIIKQDATGNAISAVMQTPQGTIFKRVPGQTAQNLTLRAELYRGGVIDTSGVKYEWFKDEVKIAAATQSITVTPDDVPNLAVYKCIITDTDSTSSTYNGKSTCYATIYDATDELRIDVETPNGTIFHNGQGTLTLIPLVMQVDTLIERGDIAATSAKFTYKWQKMANGTIDPDWTKTPVSSTAGKIQIVPADISGPTFVFATATEK